jgi:uncharacterized protein (DUF885 family)
MIAVEVASAADGDADVATDAAVGVTDPALRSLLQDHWESTLRASPLWATSLGDHRFDAAWGDPSPAGISRDRAARDRFRDRAREIRPAAPEDVFTRDLFLWNLDTDAASDVCAFETWTIGPTQHPGATLLGLRELHRVTSPEAAASFVARLTAFPAYVDATLATLAEGVRHGRVTDARTAKLTIESLDRILSQPAAEWPALAPPGDGEVALAPAAVALADGPVRAAIRRYRDFVHNAILPRARPDDSVGLWAVPAGERCYQAQIARHTTLPLTADAVHQAGLDELARIHAAFRALGRRVFGTDDLAAIFARLRDDAALRFETPDAIVARATRQLDRARDAMPRFFGRLPKAACAVRVIPAHEAPYTYVAYYSQPHADGSKPGEYYVNTYAPTTRLRHEAAVLAAHESIPGHHLQIAIGQELPDTPAFRRHLELTAYIEGWALYSERVAEEMGLYDDDLDRLGALSFDAWRASRLVVDTGLHDKQWTRAQAVAFLLANTPLAENNIRNEVDRYVAWPGQALGYKVGQLELVRLRAEAEAALGDRFDVRAFHDVVLSGGSMPLPMLRARVHAWIAQEAR